MIQYKRGDILREEVEALVNPVNCVGVMGRGLALQFKNVFPENFKSYAAACERKEMQPLRSDGTVVKGAQEHFVFHTTGFSHVVAEFLPTPTCNYASPAYHWLEAGGIATTRGAEVG